MTAERNRQISETEFGQISEEIYQTPPFPLPSSRQLSEFPSMLGDTFNSNDVKQIELWSGDEVEDREVVSFSRTEVQERMGYLEDTRHSRRHQQRVGYHRLMSQTNKRR